MTELTAPIIEGATKSNEQRVVTGPVLIPGEPDLDGDMVDAATIERVADGLIESYGNIDLQHSLKNVGKVV
ncbi:Putative phage serine protease XkdF [Marininema mesophilum]|uniref:Putative phage serine protease XkdF n=1 Tax=Marininema mesophilum TaxID=1048340 RepID=A0A1H2RCL8_9BACL|nr:XkdF-like putative serine protease domain-containing protein [Marininema mesophilum]SDW16910.1 Putative phage serine protease XkdF [Marininema mesophilum]